MIPRRNHETNAWEDYLERFYIFSKKYVGMYLHRFWNSDQDGLHDHPWNFVTIILKGSYFEEIPERQCVPHGPKLVKERKAGSIIFRTKYDAHKVLVPKGKEGECWTLFIRFGLKRRDWGFYENGSWRKAEFQSRKDIPK